MGFKKAIDGKPIRFSYSNISKFFSCQQQWAATYFYKTIKYVESEAARYGMRGHKALDEYFKKKTPLPSDFRHLKTYAKKLEDSLEDIESEKEIAFDEDWNEVGWWDHSCFQRGKIDVYNKEDDRATIVDHKFGKYSNLSLENYISELKYFTLLAMKSDEEVEKVKTVITWLKGDSKPTVEIYDRSDLPHIEDEFAEKIEIIHAAIDAEEFTYTPSGLCNGWCSNDTCKHWKPKK